MIKLVMGNSIDGFTVASVAAALSLLTENGSSTVQRDGLVLMNSAGNIIKVPIPFPIMIISGTIPKFSYPKSLPVRPNPG